MILRDNDIIIDVETSCDIDIKDAGMYKYCTHPSLRLLLLSFTVGTSDEVYTYDVINDGDVPDFVLDVLENPSYRKHAHNAAFELLVLHNTLGMKLLTEQWYCSMAAVAFCGLPLSLEDSGNMLASRHHKQTTGKDLIRFFSVPRKDGTYNKPKDNMDAWKRFIEYNKADVLAEKSNLEALPEIPEIFESGRERDMWLLDFKMNMGGVRINTTLTANADTLCAREDEEFIQSVKGMGINNPNSRKQVMEFLSERGIVVTSLKKDDYDTVLDKAVGDEIATRIIEAKQQLSMSSASKFGKFTDMNVDEHVYFMLQYYGAVRTGRWAGRGVQLQNMKRNEMPFEYLNLLRTFVLNNDYESIKMYFGSVKKNITELTRTVLEPDFGYKFLPTDFSAIEARITAWIAEEDWRLDVFRTHGKIYEASAAQMFKLRIEDIKKGSMERMKGKYAELALGFGGWTGAFERFGADKFMTKQEMLDVAKAWRASSPKVVAMWNDTFECAIQAIKNEGEAFSTKYGAIYKVIKVNSDKERRWLTCLLPSGRRLMYYEPELCISREKLSFKYRRAANEQDTWYGIMVENIVQGIARDLLVEKMLRLYKDFNVLPKFHVHDEIIVAARDGETEEMRKLLNDVMAEEIVWAKGLPLKGDTDILPFYMKGE